MCYDELTILMYADGEVDAQQRAAIDAHLERCARCEALLAAVRIESQGLTAVMSEAGLAETGALAALVDVRDVSFRTRLVAAAVVTLVAGALVRLLVSWAFTSSDEWTEWSLLQPAILLDVVLNVAEYLVQEGEVIMSSLVAAGGVLAFAVLIVSGLSMANTRVRRVASLVCFVAMCLLASAPQADALEVRRAQRVTIAADQTVDDSLVAVGETVEIDGIVTGDVIAMARRVRVRGTVRGNLLAMGRDVEVEGTVEGSLIQFGQTATARGQANGNYYAFAQTITLPQGSRVGGNATVFSQSATVEGDIGRDVTSFGRTLDVAGTVNQRVTAYGAQVNVRSGARIAGDLTAHVNNRENVQVDSGATVGGTTRVELREPERSPYLTARYYVVQMIRLAAAFVTGWILFWLVPRAARATIDSGNGLLMAVGTGAVLICATPILAVLIGVTIVGLPLALLTMLVWAALIYLAKIFVALSVGRTVLGSHDTRGVRISLALLVGLLVVIVAINLPWVGGVMNVILTITGFGLVCLELARWYKNPAPPVSA